MTKVKNVRAGIVMIADAGLKLAPGETVSVDKLTAQMNSAVEAGLLARIEESVPKPKSASKPEETKQEPTKVAQIALTDQGMESQSGADAAEQSKEAVAPVEVVSGAKRGHK